MAFSVYPGLGYGAVGHGYGTVSGHTGRPITFGGDAGGVIDATGGYGDDYLNYLGDLYGWNTQANIADLQGQYSLADRRLANEALLGVTGMQQGGANTRSMMDNSGADYRTGVDAMAGFGASVFPEIGRNERFGAVFNGIMAPFAQQYLGVGPSQAFTAPSAPQLNLGQGPDYASMIAGTQSQAPPAGSPPNVTSPTPQRPTGGVMANMAKPQAPAAPASPGRTTLPTPTGGGSPVGSSPMARMGGGSTPTIQTRPQTFGGSGAGPAPQGGVTRPQPSSPPSLTLPTPTQGQLGTTSGAAGGGGGLDIMKPLPTTVVGPQITQGPVVTQGQIGSMIGRQQGRNAAQEASANRSAERGLAAGGFGANSPQMAAMKAQNSVVRGAADQEAATTIPMGYAQMNAQHRLATEQANENAYGNRMRELLAQRQQAGDFSMRFLNMLQGFV